MTDDPARLATVHAVIDRVEPGMTLGLGSGRAVFALTKMIGERLGKHAGIRAVVASPQTAALAEEAGIEGIELTGPTRLDIAFDGADEFDSKLNMIKGGGAALLREKLVLAAADHVVIMAEATKLSDVLGTVHSLPLEVVPFAWTQTQLRVAELVDNPQLRADSRGTPVITANNNFLLDGQIAQGADLVGLAQALTNTLGVVEHGLFLHQADEIVMGRPDGTAQTLRR